MMKRSACLGLLVVAGCATTMAPVSTAERRVGEEPALLSQVERSVGDVIYATFNYEKVLAARLTEPVMIDVMAARAAIPAGSTLDAFSDGGVSAYCTKDLALNVTLSGPYSRVCLADSDRNGRFDSWKAPEGPPARMMWAKLKSEAAFSTEDSASAVTEGFRHELLYQGLSGNVIKLLYREFVNDLVRPAFQQELSYTLETSGPTEVSFRGTRLRIYSATNNAIRYEVLAGLQPGGAV